MNIMQFIVMTSQLDLHNPEILRQNIIPNPLFRSFNVLFRKEKVVVGDWVGLGLEEWGMVRDQQLQMRKKIKKPMES